MATQLRIKRRTADATAPAGLTAGEMAINLVDKKLYVGGTAGTNVIFLDSTSSVGLSTANTFTALQTFSAGISASALTVSGTITSTQGITFGSGTTFMAFVPKTAANNGGLWLRDGLFQVGGGVFGAGNGNLQYNMNAELLAVYGYQTIDNAAPYQGTVTPLTVKGGTGQSVPLFNVTRGGISAVQVHQDGYLAIPINTSPAIKIGTHATKNLTLASIDAAGEIVQTGNNSTLNIRQENGYSVSIGDYAENLNSTYISVDDSNTAITLNGAGNSIALNTSGIQISGLLDVASGLSAAGATFNGTVNIGTTALISAPSATALAIRSQIPAGTGVTPTIQIICPSAGYTLTNQIATQKVFDLPQDTITLQAATTYMFEGQYLLTTGTTTHITSMSFVLTTATMTNCSWSSTTGMPTALNAATSGAFQAIFNSVAGGNVNTTSASANTMITFKGIMRVDVGGTMVPNIAFSAQPGGTNTVLIGSYLKFYPIGANTINSVGTAIG